MRFKLVGFDEILATRKHMPDQKQYDVVLFGASGFTGALVASYLASARVPRPLRWALAGRSRDKLESVRASLISPQSAPDLVIADVNDEVSLQAMAKSAQVVITTVGPYLQFGEPLLKACVEMGADYVDLTGEPEFVDNMLERYHADAEAKKVRIVNSCGFDSIPHDLGAYFTVKALERRMSSLERGRTPIKIEGFVRAGGGMSGGTWHSAVNAMGRFRAYTNERKQRSSQLPIVGEERKVREVPPRISFQKEIGAWAVPMPTIDPLVVRRSARLLPAYGPDFQYGHYMAIRRLPTVLGILAGVGCMFALAQLGPTRKLLLKLRAQGDGPDQATREKSWFKVTLLGEAGRHKVRCEVRGGDPGYGETSKMLAESALALVFDRDRLPACYGVVPTAAAMGDVLLERLRATGITFEETSDDAAAPVTVKQAEHLAN